MTDHGERRRSESLTGFWESPFKRLLVLVLTGMIALSGWAYNSLDARKVDKETMVEIIRRLDEKMERGFEGIRNEIKAALSRRPSGWE